MDWNKALERLRADRGNWSRVARATGLHENGIRRIASGDTPWPRIDTTQKIIAYYIALDAGVSVGGDPAPTPQQAALLSPRGPMSQQQPQMHGGDRRSGERRKQWT